jgi:CRISPR type IV-associated protein Csf3
MEGLRKCIESYTVKPQEFKPFKLTFKMMTSICLSHPWVHLDGILAHLLLRKLLKENFYTLPSKMPIDFFSLLDLPLKKLRNNGTFIYHSSVSRFNRDEIYVDKIYKRFEDTKMKWMDPGRSKKIDTTRGRFKNYMINLPYIPTSQVVFYGNGDIKEIKELIKYLPGLGKKIAAGFGFYHSFKMKEIEQDTSLVNKNNEAMRPIPSEFLDVRKNYEKVMLAYKFPYWAKSTVGLCCNVGEHIKIKEDKR